MMYHLIIDGPDRCGKSVLIETFKSYHPEFEYAKMRVPRTIEDSSLFYGEHIQQLMYNESPMIWDRGIMSELVYAPLYRPETAPGWWHSLLMNMVRVTTVLPVIYAYVYPLYPDLMKADERPGSNLSTEVQAFNIVYDEMQCRKFAYTKHTIRNGEPAWKNREESYIEFINCIRDVQ